MVVGGRLWGREEAGAFKFGDGPGLGRCSVPAVGRVAIEDFGDGAEAAFIVAVAGERVEGVAGPGEAFIGAAKRFQQCFDHGSEKPGPDRALVVGGVALSDRAGVMAAVLRVIAGEGAEAIRGVEVFVDSADDGALFGLIEDGVREGDGKNLVGAELGAAGGVSEPARRGAPEGFVEARAETGGAEEGLFSEVVNGSGARPAGGEPEGVVVEGVEFDGLAVAGRDGNSMDAGVHPGKLGGFVTGGEQTVAGVGMDGEEGAAPEVIEDIAGGG